MNEMADRDARRRHMARIRLKLRPRRDGSSHAIGRARGQSRAANKLPGAMKGLNLRRIASKTNWLALHQDGGDEQTQETKSERRGRRQNPEIGSRLAIRYTLDGMTGIILTNVLARR